MALELAPQFTMLSAEERKEIQQLASTISPLFQS
jgi:hypothetical protein